MPWCPNCKTEYREGFTVCADCGSKLTDVLEETEPDERQLSEACPENDVVAESLGEAEDVWETESGEALQEAENSQPAVRAGVYRNSAEKAEDNRSSAWTLISVGGAGLAVIILGVTGILPIPLSGTNKYMIYGVMSVLFILFLVMGIFSMRSSKVFAQKAEKENSLREALEKWCRENLNPDKLDEEAGILPDMESEICYFKRFEKMKEKLNYQFVNLDQAFLEHFVDEMYDTIYAVQETGEQSL